MKDSMCSASPKKVIYTCWNLRLKRGHQFWVLLTAADSLFVRNIWIISWALLAPGNKNNRLTSTVSKSYDVISSDSNSEELIRRPHFVLQWPKRDGGANKTCGWRVHSSDLFPKRLDRETPQAQSAERQGQHSHFKLNITKGSRTAYRLPTNFPTIPLQTMLC